MIETLLLPVSFEFMQRAFLTTLVVAIPMALLSCFLVLRGWSLMGDAISHAVLPGVVLAHIVSLPFAVGAFAAGMFCAVSAGFLAENSRVKQDTILGITFSGMFGLGIVLFANIETNIHLDHVLFGDMLGLSRAEFWQTAILAALVGTVISLKYRDFMLHAFDPQQARALGLRVGLLHYGLLALISLAVVAALKSVGIILAIAFLVAPGAIAFLWSNRLETMLLSAVGLSILSVIGGIYLSFWIDSAPAPTIVLILTVVFFVTVLFKRKK